MHQRFRLLDILPHLLRERSLYRLLQGCCQVAVLLVLGVRLFTVWRIVLVPHKNDFTIFAGDRVGFKVLVVVASGDRDLFSNAEVSSPD
jgi:hypothetical protein